MKRVYNFSAGPSILPEPVLRRAADEMLDYQGSGQSVMEMSHRSKVYGGIIESAESLLREVMGIPDNYKVLFLQGGASSQFAMLPLQGLGQGAQPIISYNYGAGNKSRVKKAYFLLLKSSLFYSCLLWGGIMLFPTGFASIFTSDPQLVEFSAMALRIKSALFPVCWERTAILISAIAVTCGSERIFVASSSL